MNRDIITKVMFFLSCLLLVLTWGIHAGKYQKFPHSVFVDVQAAMQELVHEWGTLTGAKPEHFLQPARYEGDGVTVNLTDRHDGSYVFLSGFFDDTNELRLIKRDGEIVARWPVQYSTYVPDTSHLNEPPTTDWNVDLHGALMEADGSVVFNFESSGLVKLDRCGKMEWVVKTASHHSVEPAREGGYWVPGTLFHARRTKSEFRPFVTPFVEDTIMHISADGELLKEISVPGLFYSNGLEALLTSSGHQFDAAMGWDGEILHVNKIAELDESLADQFPDFDAGDLVLSLRNLNMLMVVDPATETVKWWRIGPWIRQHDPEFGPGGVIVLFNNNVYRTAFAAGRDVSWTTTALSVPRISNILSVNPTTDDVQILYGTRDGEELLSVIRGKVDLTGQGGLLITEFEAGRVIETDAEGNIVWEYINRFDEDEVAELTEAKLYSPEYFDVTDWSCEQ